MKKATARYTKQYEDPNDRRLITNLQANLKKKFTPQNCPRLALILFLI